MKELIIIKEAYCSLLGIILSCWPLERQNRLIPIVHSLTEKMDNETTISFDQLIAVLPLEMKTSVLHKIKQYVEELGKTEIDQEVIWSFFAGTRHIKAKTIEVVEIFSKDKPAWFNCWIIGHTLLPVKLEQRDGQLIGIYENKNRKVVLKGLYLPRYLKSWNEQDIALVHFATVVAIGCPLKLANRFQEEQWKNKNFRQALERCQGIDYHLFMGQNYTLNTRERFKKFIGEKK